MAKAESGNVKLHLYKTLDEVLGDNMGVTGIRIRDTRNDELSELELAGVFISPSVISQTHKCLPVSSTWKTVI